MKSHKVSSRAKLAPVLYGDPVCVLLSARMRERTWRTYVPRSETRKKGARCASHCVWWWRRGELRHKDKCLTKDIDLQAGRSARATARAKASAAPPPNPRESLSSRLRRCLSICFPLRSKFRERAGRSPTGYIKIRRTPTLRCPSDFGGDEGTRTPDLCVANASLYHLSHAPTACVL